MTMLSPHFSAEEMTKTNTCLPNKPEGQELVNLCNTANQLEKVRDILGVPLSITSGYRSPAVNQAVRGVKTSAHCEGYAADFEPYAPLQRMEAAQKIAASELAFDQLILEYGWIHISFDPKMRRELLTKKDALSPYLKGLIA